MAVETEDDDETKTAHSSSQSAGKSAAKKVNAKGLLVLRNGVVSMRDLELCADRHTKSRDPDVCKLFDASLRSVKLFNSSLWFTLVKTIRWRKSGARMHVGC